MGANSSRIRAEASAGRSRSGAAAPVEPVCFDVGYTLIDETRSWLALARQIGVRPERLFAELQASIERGEGHMQALHRLGPELDLARERTQLFGGEGASSFQVGDIYADALPTVERCTRWATGPL